MMHLFSHLTSLTKLDTLDTRHRDKVKQLATDYEQLSISENGFELGYSGDLYDDEYDDTYDANDVGADDADEALELMGR